IGAGTAWCAAMIAREIFGNTAAIIAAIPTAIYPYYAVHDTALQETGLFTFLPALAVLLLLRARRSGSAVTAACAGRSVGAALLTRAHLAPVGVLRPRCVVLAGGALAASWPRRLGVVVLCAGVAALAVGPWLIRSSQLTGSASLSSQTGFFLWVGS